MRSSSLSVRSIAAAALTAALVTVPSASFAGGQYPPSGPSPVRTPAVSPGVSDAEDAAALPRTGSDMTGWALGGGAFVAAGGALVLLARRRTEPDHG